jgi:DNA polymerase elongation subunit (family B)
LIDLCVDIETTGLNFFESSSASQENPNPEDVIIAIGYKNDYVHGSFLGDEKQVLKEFIQFIDDLQAKHGSVRIIGYNIKAFDIPFIFYRCMKHDIGLGGFKDVVRGMKEWNNPFVLDLYAFLNFRLFKNNFSLSSVLKSFGLEGKYKDFEGKDAKNLSPEDLKGYVEQDVQIEWDLYKRLVKFEVVM